MALDCDCLTSPGAEKTLALGHFGFGQFGFARVYDSEVCPMETRSNFAETDLHILTFDIPDDALERAAGADPAITLVNCTNPMVFQCPVMGE
jgi:hypothetical protein